LFKSKTAGEKAGRVFDMGFYAGEWSFDSPPALNRLGAEKDSESWS